MTLSEIEFFVTLCTADQKVRCCHQMRFANIGRRVGKRGKGKGEGKAKGGDAGRNERRGEVEQLEQGRRLAEAGPDVQ